MRVNPIRFGGRIECSFTMGLGLGADWSLKTLGHDIDTHNCDYCHLAAFGNLITMKATQDGDHGNRHKVASLNRGAPFGGNGHCGISDEASGRFGGHLRLKVLIAVAGVQAAPPKVASAQKKPGDTGQ